MFSINPDLYCSIRFDLDLNLSNRLLILLRNFKCANFTNFSETSKTDFSTAEFPNIKIILPQKIMCLEIPAIENASVNIVESTYRCPST